MMALNGGGNDQQANCILEICCGGANSKQKQALTEVAQHALEFLSHDQSGEVATFVAKWDLAPKGTLPEFPSYYLHLEEVLHALPFLSAAEAEAVRDWVMRNWSLYPKGSLYAFKQAIAKLAKGPAYAG